MSPDRERQRKSKTYWPERLLLAISRPLLVQGIKPPWNRWLQRRLDPIEAQQISRERLSYQIKTAEYRLGYGPIWLKKTAQIVSRFWYAYRFWLFVALKITSSVLVVTTPIALIFLFKIVLPDPDHLSKGGLSESRVAINGLVTDSPNQNRATLSPYELLSDELGAVKSGAVPLGLGYGGFPEFIGFQPHSSEQPSSMGLVVSRVPGHKAAPFAARPSVIVRDQTPLVFVLDPVGSGPYQPAAEVLGANRISGNFLVFSALREKVKCRLELRDERQNVLISVEKPAAIGPKVPGFGQRLVRPLAGDIFEGSEAWLSYRFRTDELPKRLVFSVREVVSARDTVGAGSSSSEAIETGGSADSRCLAAVTPPQFEKRVLKPLALQGVVLVLMDGVWEPISRRADLMPRLQSINESGERHSHHFSTSTDASRSIGAILGDVFDDGSHRPLLPLFKLAKNVGYRTAFFGDADDLYLAETHSAFGDNLPDLIMGFPQDGYRGAGALAQARSWIGASGSAPFFLAVRLSDLRSRWIPPWRNIDSSALSQSPAGYGALYSLYKSMIRTVDSSVGRVQDAVKEYSKASGRPVLTVFAGSSGMQVVERTAVIGRGVGSYYRGASFAQGRSLTPDMIHVPLVVSHIGVEQSNSALANQVSGSQSKQPMQTQTPGESGISTHRQLNWALASLVSQRESSFLLERATGPVQVQSLESNGYLLRTEGQLRESVVKLWSPDSASGGQRFFLRDLPYRALTSSDKSGFRPVEVWSYDSETGVMDASPILPSNKPSVGTSQILNISAGLAKSRSLILRPIVADDFALVLEGHAQDSMVQVRYLRNGASAILPPTVRINKEPGKLELSGAVAIDGEEQRFVIDGIPIEGEVSLNVRSASGFSVCGVSLGQASIQLDSRTFRSFLSHPPQCAVPIGGVSVERTVSQEGPLVGFDLSVGWPQPPSF